MSSRSLNAHPARHSASGPAIAAARSAARSALSRLFGGIRPVPVLLLALAMLVELPTLYLRATLLTILAIAGMQLFGHVLLLPGMLALFAPFIWPPLAFIAPAGGWWWRQIQGGRHPSQRERLAYQDSIEMLQANSPRPLTLPSNWFVIDTPDANAAVCGRTLMLSRGLLENEHLPAVIAHELGHLATSDGRLTAALNRLIITIPRPGPHTDREHRPRVEQQPQTEQPDPTLQRFAKTVALLLCGGIGLYFTRPIWGAYWRAREYHADAYAANLGQADDLADFLDNHALIHDLPIPLVWLTEQTHPPTELRIDRLRAHTESAA